MPRIPTVRRADLDRTLKALQAAGYAPGQVEVRPGGEVVITPRALTAEPAPSQPDELTAWREQRRARGAAQGA